MPTCSSEQVQLLYDNSYETIINFDSCCQAMWHGVYGAPRQHTTAIQQRAQPGGSTTSETV